MSRIELIATAAFGLESIVAGEIRELGYDDVKSGIGRVTFIADEAAIPRANLWLRTADRILLKFGEFQALTFDELFEKTKALPWPDWLPRDANFPVEGKSIQSKLFSVSDCQAIVKKAIVERMKQRYGGQWFAETGPRYTVEVGLLRDVATLTVDTSGAGLHKRGYRKLGSSAPLKETLAAAIIRLSRWNSESAFIDPLCGSGTLPIEAALLALNMAPGANREFASEYWPTIPKRLWKTARDEARDLVRSDSQLKIFGYDIDGEVLSLARYHAKLAGVDKVVAFQRQPVAELRSRHKYGHIVCNPPYGERLGEDREVARIYRDMGKSFTGLDTWSYYVLTTHPGFEKLFGVYADKKRRFFNGKLECTLYQFFGPKPPKKNADHPEDSRQGDDPQG